MSNKWDAIAKGLSVRENTEMEGEDAQAVADAVSLLARMNITVEPPVVSLVPGEAIIYWRRREHAVDISFLGDGMYEYFCIERASGDKVIGEAQVSKGPASELMDFINRVVPKATDEVAA